MSRQRVTSNCQTVMAFSKCPVVTYVGALYVSVDDYWLGESQTGDDVLWVQNRTRLIVLY